jgi:hypothetical protein
MTGLKYPVHPSNMTKFERQNGISVNVLGYENKELFPIYLTKLRNARHEVDLLYGKLENVILSFDRQSSMLCTMN